MNYFLIFSYPSQPLCFHFTILVDHPLLEKFPTMMQNIGLGFWGLLYFDYTMQIYQ
jgi:hypothetical protein